MALAVKNPPANAGDIRDAVSVPELGRSPGEEHGNPLQYSCLENPLDRRAWPVTAHGVAKSQSQLKRLSTHARPLSHLGWGRLVASNPYTHTHTHTHKELVLFRLGGGIGKDNVCVCV